MRTSRKYNQLNNVLISVVFIQVIFIGFGCSSDTASNETEETPITEENPPTPATPPVKLDSINDDTITIASKITGTIENAQFLALNMNWGSAVYTYLDRNYTLRWEGRDGYLLGRSKKYYQSLAEYRLRNNACVNNQPTECYTILKHRNNGVGDLVGGCPDNIAAEFVTLRYGFYCGKNHPAEDLPAFTHPAIPLDPVDYCCRLHDDAAWYPNGNPDGNAESEVLKACGMMKCLESAEMTSGLFSTIMGETSRARQCWYDMSKTICETGGTLASPDIVSPATAPVVATDDSGIGL